MDDMSSGERLRKRVFWIVLALVLLAVVLTLWGMSETVAAEWLANHS